MIETNVRGVPVIWLDDEDQEWLRALFRSVKKPPRPSKIDVDSNPEVGCHGGEDGAGLPRSPREDSVQD